MVMGQKPCGFHWNPAGMEADVMGVSQRMETNGVGLNTGLKRNAEMKSRFTVMQLLLCHQWQKRICQHCLSNPFPTTV